MGSKVKTPLSPEKQLERSILRAFKALAKKKRKA